MQIQLDRKENSYHTTVLGTEEIRPREIYKTEESSIILNSVSYKC